jgi:hypothetical protein
MLTKPNFFTGFIFILPSNLQPYSVEQGNVIGDQFGLRSGEFWFNPLDDHGSHVTVSYAMLHYVTVVGQDL